MLVEELATLLKHIYKHQGEPMDIVVVEKLLPPEVDYTQVERSLIKEHLIIPGNTAWLLTPKGMLYAEVLLAFLILIIIS